MKKIISIVSFYFSLQLLCAEGLSSLTTDLVIKTNNLAKKARVLINPNPTSQQNQAYAAIAAFTIKTREFHGAINSHYDTRYLLEQLEYKFYDMNQTFGGLFVFFRPYERRYRYESCVQVTCRSYHRHVSESDYVRFYPVPNRDAAESDLHRRLESLSDLLNQIRLTIGWAGRN